MSKTTLLFLCFDNSARSRMAAAWCNHLYGDRFEADSAGFEPGTLNPLAVEVMREVGLDISGNRPRLASELSRGFDYVITLDDQSNAEFRGPRFWPWQAQPKGLPILTSLNKHLHWSVPDSAALTGPDALTREGFRTLRDAIHDAVELWGPRLCQPDISLHRYPPAYLKGSFRALTAPLYLGLLLSAASAGDFTRLIQYGLAVFVGLWVVALVSQWLHVTELARDGQTATMTVADKFSYEYHTEGDDKIVSRREHVVVYHAALPDADGSAQMTTAFERRPQREYAQFQATPLGRAISVVKHTRSVFGMLSRDEWTIFEPRVWSKTFFLRLFGPDAVMLAVVSSTALWIRAVFLAANVRLSDLITPDGAAQWRGALLSSDAAQQLWNAARQVPAVPVTTLVSLTVSGVFIAAAVGLKKSSLHAFSA